MSDAVVHLEGLRLTHGEGAFALTVPALTLRAGESLCLLGPSGSGKTTLLHALAGIHVPEAGHLDVLGQDLSAGSALAADPSARRTFRRKELGLVFQTFALLAHLDVRDNLRLPLLYHPELARGANAVGEARIQEVADRLGIGDKLGRLPHRLSQGERQRVAIGRALLQSPRLILADEPTGNLDPETTATILDLFLATVAEHEAGLVMVTHDHGLADRFDQVLDLRALAVDGAA